MRITLLAVAILAAPATALAQTPAPGQQDMMKMMQLAAHNQLGVFEFCQAQGAVGTDAVDLQRRLIGMLPPPTGIDGLDDAEAAGKEGRVEFAGTKVVLADAAKAKGVSTADMCKQMATLVQTQAAQLPK